MVATPLSSIGMGAGGCKGYIYGMNGIDLKEKTSVYKIDIQILSPKEDENIINDMEINSDKSQGKFFTKLKPGSMCLIELALDKVIWYMKDGKYYLYENNQEITKKEAEEMAGRQIP